MLQIFLSVGCITTHSTVIVVCFVSVVIEHKLSELQVILLISGMKCHKVAQDLLVTALVNENIVIKWCILQVSPYSSVGIATGYGLDSLGSIPGKAKFFSSSPLSTDPGAHLA
jgi:uncharacterized membrane protein